MQFEHKSRSKVLFLYSIRKVLTISESNELNVIFVVDKMTWLDWPDEITEV